MSTSGYDAVVLAGGRARRMDGVDKTALPVGGRPLLDRVLDAVGAADRVVVVGAPRPVPRPVEWTREQPPGSGPAAAVAAGLATVTADVVVLLAADLPFMTPAVVDRLVAAVVDGGCRSGAVLVDDDGRHQWLCSAWPAELLRRAGLAAGGSLHRAVAALPFVPLPDDTAGPPAWLDCDTPADLAAATAAADPRP